MPTGLLGSSILTALNEDVIYTVPTGKVATVSVNVCNRNVANTFVRIAVADVATDASYIEYDFELTQGDIIERTGIVIGAGQSIYVRSSLADSSAQVWGWEEDA